MISGEPLEIRQAKAQALREAADAIRSTEVMFLDADGSAIKVNDLLREMATDHLRPASPRCVPSCATWPPGMCR